MSNGKDTVDYTVRGFSQEFDRTLTDLSVVMNKPKSTIIREIAEQHLTDRIKTFGMLNKHVAVLDEILAKHLGATLFDRPYENHFVTKKNLEMVKLLDITSDEVLERILVENTPYITVRGDQVLKGYKSITRGTSLWFALFAKVAFSDEATIKQAWDTIYYSPYEERYERYYNNINELRKLHKDNPVQPQKNDVKYK